MGYDTFDSAVVVAQTETEARRTHPYGSAADWQDNVWATKPEDVYVKLIGTALPSQRAGVVLASFNAG